MKIKFCYLTLLSISIINLNLYSAATITDDFKYKEDGIDDISATEGNKLIMAAMFNEVYKAEKLINAGANIDITTRDGETPLITAVELGREDIVKLLLKAGANLKILNNVDKTALDIAKDRTNVEIVQLLEDEPVRRQDALHLYNEIISKVTALPKDLINILNSYEPRHSNISDSLLYIYRLENINENLKKTGISLPIASIINSYFSVDIAQKEKDKAFLDHIDRYYNDDNKLDFDKLKKFIENGANINAVDKRGKTALICAIERRCSKTEFDQIKEFIESGRIRGITKLEASALSNSAYTYKDLIPWLIASGININAINESGSTALMEACSKGNIDTVSLLIGTGAVTNYDYALQRAAHRGQCNLAQLLIDAKANVNFSSRYGHTALISATLFENNFESWLYGHKTDPETIASHENMVKLLLANKANIDASEDSGYTALIYAAQKAHTGIVKILLEHGADIDKTTRQDYGRKTARDLVSIESSSIGINSAKEKAFNEINKLLFDAKDRKSIKRRQESIIKIISQDLPDTNRLPKVIAQIISQMATSDLEDVPWEERR